MKEENNEMTQVDAAMLKIANAVRDNDYTLTLKTPTTVTFNYIDDNGDEADSEATVMRLTYDAYDGEIYAVTDHEFFKEIPLGSLWNSSIKAIANFAI